MKNKLVVVTGKPGVGKTTILRDSKVPYISIDEINEKYWIKKGSEFYDFVLKTFGQKYVNDLSINKSELGKLVFSNDDAMKKLNNFANKGLKKFFMSLEGFHVIEFAQYINHEKYFKGIFSKVILIVSDNPNISSKFTYLKAKPNPIENRAVKNDFRLVNDFSPKIVEQFRKIIMEIEYEN